MSGTIESTKKPFVFIFDGPVSCSKLFGKLLSTHPQLQAIHGYPYLLAGSRGPEQIPARLTEATQQRLYTKWQNEVRPEDLARWSKMTFEQTNQDVAAGIEAIRGQGKLPIVQEHAALCIQADVSLECLRQATPDFDSYIKQNPTVIDNELIRNCIPVVLIRHPALYIPSFYRKQKKEEMLDLDDEAFQLWISMYWVRMLYDYFAASATDSSQTPIVVDAEDVVHNTSNLSNKLSKILGIDPEGIKDTWDASHNGPVPEGVVASFHDRLMKSSGVERDDTKVLDSDIDLDEKLYAWKEEFGSEIANELRARVDAEMPIYSYLQSRKL